MRFKTQNMVIKNTYKGLITSVLFIFIGMFYAKAQTTAPTDIEGSTVCDNTGDTVVLTASGGNNSGVNVVEVWYPGDCPNIPYRRDWDTRPAAGELSNANVIANFNGILRLRASGSIAPHIEMTNIGPFNPNVYKYVNIRYRVITASPTRTPATALIMYFFNAATNNVARTGYSKLAVMEDDGQWHVMSIDLSIHSEYTTGGNITGFRYAYALEGTDIELDFFEFSDTPILAWGPEYEVPATNGTQYSVTRRGFNVNTACISKTIVVNPLAEPTFNAQPESLSLLGSEQRYETQAPTELGTGASNYVWDPVGVLNTDYNIVSGGSTNDNFIVLEWLTKGNKTVRVNYENDLGCPANNPTSSLVTRVRENALLPTGAFSINYGFTVDANGNKNTNGGLDKTGRKVLD